MRNLAIKIIFMTTVLYASEFCPAWGHVKWFLSRPENEILKQAKPALFTQLSIENLLPLSALIVLMRYAYHFNLRYINSVKNKQIIGWAQRHEAIINLLMAMGLATSLIFCGLTKTLLVPNFIICSHCPQWLPAAEIIVGVYLALGFMSRLAGLAVLGLFYMAVVKHGLAECLDLLPLTGVALYFILCGRHKFSLDKILKIDNFNSPLTAKLGHYFIRVTMGLGLIILSLSEKLMQPQLAMDLLQHIPSLNLCRCFGMPNDMFILLSGLTELFLGVTILLGYFPRISAACLLLIFCGTTAVFGREEFFGHAACYSSILSILLWGASRMQYTIDLTLANPIMDKLLAEFRVNSQKPKDLISGFNSPEPPTSATAAAAGITTSSNV